ncbi:RING zinc finger-containing protein, partial [Reticulomyxa filosa]
MCANEDAPGSGNKSVVMFATSPAQASTSQTRYPQTSIPLQTSVGTSSLLDMPVPMEEDPNIKQSPIKISVSNVDKLSSEQKAGASAVGKEETVTTITTTTAAATTTTTTIHMTEKTAKQDWNRLGLHQQQQQQQQQQQTNTKNTKNNVAGDNQIYNNYFYSHHSNLNNPFSLNQDTSILRNFSIRGGGLSS